MGWLSSRLIESPCYGPNANLLSESIFDQATPSTKCERCPHQGYHSARRAAERPRQEAFAKQNQWFFRTRVGGRLSSPANLEIPFQKVFAQTVKRHEQDERSRPFLR